MASFVGVYLYKVQTTGHAFTYSIDFTGGTQVLLQLEKPVGIEKIKKIVEDAGWQGATVRTFSNEREIEVRVKELSSDTKGLAQKIAGTIETGIESNKITILQSDTVTAGGSAGLRWKSIRAITIASLALLAYIAWRFWSFGFAVGAVAALLHDVFIVLFVLFIFGREVSNTLIAAILTVLGYSINDTIIIFSRIRDNLAARSQKSLYQVVNESLNHTLRRTLLTSFSTALTVIAMLVLGGEALRDFALALLVGIIFGTYSSIYIASPIMMLLHKDNK